jgi:hypothetical protein
MVRQAEKRSGPLVWTLQDNNSLGQPKIDYLSGL